MKKRLFVILALVLAVFMVFAFTACGGGGAPASTGNSGTTEQPAAGPSDGNSGSSGDATYKMKASTYLPESDPMYKLVLKYCDTVKEKSNGDIVITVYPAEALGPYDQTFEETMRGTIEFGFNAVPATKDSRLEAAHVPGVVGDYNKIEKVLSPDGIVFKTVDTAMDDLNIKVLGWLYGGYAHLALRGDPEEGYANPDVAKRSTIRVPSTLAVYNDVITALNYKTASLNGTEVYSSLQTGIIDGTIGQSNSFILSGFSDVVKNIIDIKAKIEADLVFINKDLYESMPAEYQQILQDAADVLSAETVAYQRDQEGAIEEELEKVGITIIHISPEEQAAIDRTMIEKVWPNVEKRMGKDFIDSLKKDFGIE